MASLHLKIITPQKIILETDVSSITAPSSEGEITILPYHTNLFALLIEGIVKIKYEAKEDFLAIGGGYLETNGEEVNILVSRAYKQEEIDEEVTRKAIDEAQKILKETKDQKQRAEATAILRRSIVDAKLLKKRKKSKY